MTRSGSLSATISAVETLMLEKFRTEPFHNLHLLYGTQLHHPEQGGTCSDKTLSFLSAAQQAGFDVALHSGFINDKEIHRLARVHIHGQIFFADVGDGWPSLKLYPADRVIDYRCFGIRFRTEITGSRVTVFNERNGKETPQLGINIHGKPESEIHADIARRFRTGTVYPFSKSLRFSLVVGDQFLFLRGNRLEIYHDSGFRTVEGINEIEVPLVIQKYFGVDVRPLLPANFGDHANQKPNS
jgi:arylamine N-acetyltransferase